ncbi:MAG: BglG family transcription antiterminator [Erysipelotrichaceae bacterium]|nr:BglG family transcription antiterminator [Erysipelotrichaceae bacterium]
MDIKALQIYSILAEAEGYVPQEEICEKLDMKPRTLREYIKESRDVLLRACGAQVIQKSNRGYMIETDDRESLLNYLKKEKQKTAQQEYVTPISREGRVDYIIRTYLCSRKYQRYEDIADRIFASHTTVFSDLKYVREKLAEYNLELESRQTLGMRIKGSEKDIRNCISDYFFHDDFSGSQVFHNQPLGMFESRYTSEISRITSQVLKDNHYTLTDIGLENLNIHILIALFRIQSDEYIPDVTPIHTDREKNASVLKIACEIKDRIQETFDVKMPDREVDYMMIHLLGSRVFDAENDENLIQPETLNIVRTILSAVLNQYGIDFFSDLDLFTMLCMHLQPMITRLKNNVRLHNPILDDIKEGNPIGYEMAVLACEVLGKEYNTKVDEQEIGYLALHFQLALERKKSSHRKKRVLAVCASGAGTSRLLMFRLQARFSDEIEEIKAASLADLENVSPDTCDLIVSTVPIERRMPVPVLQVKYSLSDSDAERIRDVFMETEEDIQIIRGFFSESLFFSDQAFRNKEEVIHFLCTKMMKETELPAVFEASVLQREKLASTDLGLGIAMPHPMTLMAKRTCVAVCHLKNPIRWGKQKVRIVFLLASRKEGGEVYTLFNRVIYASVNDERFVRRITETPSYDVFMEEITRMCRAQKSRKPESIFQ